MKQLIITFFLTIVFSEYAYANKVSISCRGQNTPDATFTVTNDNIIVSDGFVFELEGVTSTTATGYKHYYKKNLLGLKKIDSSWNIDINLNSRSAIITTYREFEGGVAKDIYRRKYYNCSW